MSTAFEERVWHFCRDLQCVLLRIFTPIAEEMHVTLPQIGILFEICNCQSLTIGQLSDHISMNRGNCSTLCKRLEQQGFLVRERNPLDQRMVLLSPTQKGKDVCHLILQGVSQQHFAMLQTYPPGEIASIEESMDRVTDFLHQLLATKEES